jgi:hypothetical protein
VTSQRPFGLPWLARSAAVCTIMDLVGNLENTTGGVVGSEDGARNNVVCRFEQYSQPSSKVAQLEHGGGLARVRDETGPVGGLVPVKVGDAVGSWWMQWLGLGCRLEYLQKRTMAVLVRRKMEISDKLAHVRSGIKDCALPSGAARYYYRLPTGTDGNAVTILGEVCIASTLFLVKTTAAGSSHHGRIL